MHRRLQMDLVAVYDRINTRNKSCDYSDRQTLSRVFLSQPHPVPVFPLVACTPYHIFHERSGLENRDSLSLVQDGVEDFEDGRTVLGVLHLACRKKYRPQQELDIGSRQITGIKKDLVGLVKSFCLRFSLLLRSG